LAERAVLVVRAAAGARREVADDAALLAALAFAGLAAFGPVAPDALAGCGAAADAVFGAPLPVVLAGSLAAGVAALAETTGRLAEAVVVEEAGGLAVDGVVEAPALVPRPSRMVSGRTLSTFGMALTNKDFLKY
jgi:hypothetical protein